MIDEAGTRVKDATVVLDSVRATETDARGRFQLDSLSWGNHRLEARHIGYNPLAATVVLSPGTADVTITLRPGQLILPELSVKARRPRLEKVGFYRRRGEEDGRFLERETLLHLDSLSLLRGLSRLPGFRYKTPGALDPDVASHACRKGFHLWLNGWEIRDEDMAFFLRTLSPSDLDGVEIYEDATAPQIFSGLRPGRCVLAVWER